VAADPASTALANAAVQLVERLQRAIEMSMPASGHGGMDTATYVSRRREGSHRRAFAAQTGSHFPVPKSDLDLKRLRYQNRWYAWLSRQGEQATGATWTQEFAV
jgi:hypothetical protein